MNALKTASQRRENARDTPQPPLPSPLLRNSASFGAAPRTGARVAATGSANPRSPPPPPPRRDARRGTTTTWRTPQPQAPWPAPVRPTCRAAERPRRPNPGRATRRCRCPWASPARARRSTWVDLQALPKRASIRRRKNWKSERGMNNSANWEIGLCVSPALKTVRWEGSERKGN